MIIREQEISVIYGYVRGDHCRLNIQVRKYAHNVQFLELCRKPPMLTEL
jgi:hypothetical protein